MLSGCMSTKPVDSKDGGKDEYSGDDTVEEDDSGIIQVSYDELNINNKIPKVPDEYNTTANNTR